ncbi:MAG: hypothetical protein NC211_03645 [Alistipes senegalensis]|nr:hypothetical protein [Oxalobacter formigenes]MCM1280912.1 hypothetical protein [Alistipes senegalensis]
MLTNVPNSINRLARNVVMNHPNSINCQVFRKVITRPAPETMGGEPTMGGLGVLDNQDEEDFEYQFLGNGYALQVESFSPALMMDNADANIGALSEFRFLIEPEEPSGHPDWFDVRKHDMVYLLLGIEPDDAKLAFEVIDIETTSNIPPYTTRYIMNRRDDLHIPAK